MLTATDRGRRATGMHVLAQPSLRSQGVVHTFMNAGAEPGVLVIGVAPGGFEMMFAERQGVDADTNRTIMERHNMAIVGPPLR
jgi:hypothetical protein